MKAEPLVLVALGSNLGDSRKILSEVMAVFSTFGRQLRPSSFWETTPVDCPPGSPTFLNAALSFHPRNLQETPESLHAKLQKLEADFGRQPKTIPNEARPLDLDLIAFGDQTRRSPTLTLPHPRAHLRKFVLAPLAEIAPDFILPGQASSITDLLSRLHSGEEIRKIPGC